MEDNQDNQVPNPQLPLEEEESDSSSPTRSIKWFIIGGILIVFLAAAAFLGARLLKPPGDASGQGSGGMFFTSKGGPGGQKSVRVDMTPASELPQTPTATRGLFVRRQDQSIFVGTGNVRMMAKPSSGSDQPNVSANYDGPVVEVVINHETKVYQDITDMTPPDSTANGGTFTIQQVVKPGSLDDLGTNSMISVWGDKQGDRYIANVVVFR
jgi:hypothetical protein